MHIYNGYVYIHILIFLSCISANKSRTCLLLNLHRFQKNRYSLLDPICLLNNLSILTQLAIQATALMPMDLWKPPTFPLNINREN